MTDEEKAKRLKELVPELSLNNAEILFRVRPSTEWEFTRISVIKRAEEVIKDIEAGITESPLYKALS